MGKYNFFQNFPKIENLLNRYLYKTFKEIENAGTKSKEIDFMSQHLKFIASLRIMVEELSTLASGYEVDGGQLRFELFKWLEKEFDVLRRVCDYQTESQADFEELSEEPEVTLDEK